MYKFLKKQIFGGKMGFIKLQQKMIEIGKKKKDLALLLGISNNSVTNKLSGKNDFSLNEVILIQSNWFPEMSIEEIFETKE